MRNYFSIYFYLLLGYSFAQQTPQYTQFTFNKYGFNPAAAGTNINSKVEAIMGIRKQWIGFTQAPASNFVCFNYTIRPERSYKRWHNVGIYTTNDKAGIYQNFGIYASYTIHIPLTNKLTASCGIFAGARRFTLATGFVSEMDPVRINTSQPVWTYPDIIPGIRLYNKKMFFDISVQQIYKNRQVQGDKQIGNKSVLTPHTYITYGRQFALDKGFLLVPAINLHGSFSGIPSAELNVMAYYQKRVGAGLTIRNTDFISGIFQVRFLKNITAGIAYDFTINRFNSAYSNTIEFMIGATPMMALLGSDRGRTSVAKCPDFDF